MVLLIQPNGYSTVPVARRICVSIFMMALLLTGRSVAAFSSRGILPIHRMSIAKSRVTNDLLIVRHASVTGIVYQADGDDNSQNNPQVTLFTKEGCTLCDKVKDVLKEFQEEIPHSLDQIDITDEAHSEWQAKYKHDIPVCHLNGQYWLKHRTTAGEVRAGLLEAVEGKFVAQPGEPNAEAMERN